MTRTDAHTDTALNGSLPTQLGKLTDLEVLVVANNDLTGIRNSAALVASPSFTHALMIMAYLDVVRHVRRSSKVLW